MQLADTGPLETYCFPSRLDLLCDQLELDEFLLELDEDVEGMQSTIYFLQQQLRQTRDQLTAVQKENEALRTSCAATSDATAQLPASPSAYGRSNGTTSDHSIDQSSCSPGPHADPSLEAKSTKQQPHHES